MIMLKILQYQIVVHDFLSCIQNGKNGIQIRVYKINNESVTRFIQLISEKVKKILIKSQAQFREKLRKFKLRQNNGFLINKTCIQTTKTNASLKLIYHFSQIYKPFQKLSLTFPGFRWLMKIGQFSRFCSKHG